MHNCTFFADMWEFCKNTFVVKSFFINFAPAKARGGVFYAEIRKPYTTRNR